MTPTDFGSNGERRIARARAEKLSPEEKAARDRLSRQRWNEANPDYKRLWREANPEKHRAHSRASAARRRAKDTRNATARAKYKENPEPERERGRRFREEHPEKVAEYARRYKEKHPDRAAEQSRRATQTWRDRNAPQQREKQRAAAAEKRAADPDKFRSWYQANLERERERSREAARLRSRLKALGLPPRKIARVYAADRRANETEAERFFSQRRTVAQRAAIRLELKPEPGLSGNPTRTISREPVKPATQAELADWVRRAALARAGKTPQERRAMLHEYLQKNGARLRDEITLDSRARVARGAPPLDVKKEMSSRAAAELSAAEGERLTRVVNRALASYGLPAAAAVQGKRPATPAQQPALPRKERDDRSR
ncbi:hypothetical protein [Microbacterium aurantiacum]|uniref:hypothetical protein n=1 Tax=Microbacterium aurantiacum TaxID=162393 RepID=UPI003F4998A7